MRRDIYTTYLEAGGVAFAWIGALVAPIFLTTGLEEGLTANFYIGIAALFIVFLAIYDGIKGLKRGVYSDFWVRAVVPLVLVLLSLLMFGCLGQSTDLSLRQYLDPITGEQQVLQKYEIGPWSVYAYPGSEGAFIMLTKHGKPLVSVTDLESRAVFVHSENSNIAVTVTDEGADGEFNRIEYGSNHFFARDSNFDGWIDSLTLDGQTQIWLENEWREVFSGETEGGSRAHFVDIASSLHRVVFKDGSWRIAPEIDQ